MSLQHVLETLTSFGLKRTEAQVYVFLAKKGPHKGRDLSKALSLPRQRLYPCLKCLKNRKLVTSSMNHPALFAAVPFEKAIDLLVKAKLEEAQSTKQNTDKALSDWQAMLKEKNTNQQTETQKSS